MERSKSGRISNQAHIAHARGRLDATMRDSRGLVEHWMKLSQTIIPTPLLLSPLKLQIRVLSLKTVAPGRKTCRRLPQAKPLLVMGCISLAQISLQEHTKILVLKDVIMLGSA